MLDAPALRRQIGAGVRRARRRAGLSLEAAAERLDRSPSGLQHIEKGRRSLAVEQLPTIASGLSCTLRQLLADMKLLRRAPKTRAPGHTTGLPDGDGSALGDRSTVGDPRGEAGHRHRTARIRLIDR